MKIHHFYIYLERGNFSFHSCLCLLFLCVYGKCTFRIFLIFPACTCHQDSVKLIKKLFLYLILALHLGKFLYVEPKEGRQDNPLVQYESVIELKMECMVSCVCTNLSKPESHITVGAVSQRMQMYWPRTCAYISAQCSTAIWIYKDQVYTSLNIL